MSIHVTHRGTTQTLTQWAASLGIDRTTIRRRLKAGWSIADALNPTDTRGAHMIGRRMPAARRRKISYSMRRRGGSGKSAELVSLDIMSLDGDPRPQVSDCLLYADPLEILCAAETAEARIATEGRTFDV